MSWSKTFVGKPEKITDEIRKDPGEMPPAVRDACKLALGSLAPDRPVIFETSGHVDSASGDFTIRARSVDAIV